MRDYNKEFIAEEFGEEALSKIEDYQKGSNANTILVYSDGNVFEILGGLLTNHSNSIDDVIRLLDIDMDAYVDAQGWDGWDYESLGLINVD